MKYRAILFDMDGTLLPMDMDTFTSGYFKGLCKKLAKYGLEPKTLVDAIWAATGAMVKNDGTMTNAERFWIYFEKITGISEELVGDDCLDFYANEFKEAVVYTQPNPLAKEAVELSRKLAEHVILATNPLFPMVGQKMRMSWVGLTPEDFDLVTSYETETYCKPNPMYYQSICERMNLDPKECLMIGNDETEDMWAAAKIGMDCYLVTDCRIPSEKTPWEGPKGTFAELVELLRK